MRTNDLNITNQVYKIKEEELKKLKNEVEFSRMINSNILPLNMNLIKYLGLDAALFLSAAYEEVMFFRSLGKEPTEWISLTKNKIKSKTGLGAARQKSAIEVLEEHHLIEVKTMNTVPKIRKIKFNYNIITTFQRDLNSFLDDNLIKKRESQDEFKKKMNEKSKEFYDVFIDNEPDELTGQEVLEKHHDKLLEKMTFSYEEYVKTWREEHPDEDFVKAHQWENTTSDSPVRFMSGFEF